MNEKPCSCCHDVKPLEEFGFQTRGLYGRRSKCKKCIKDYAAEKYANGEKKRRRAVKDEYIAAQIKVCITCTREKDKSQFREAKGNADKLNNECYECYDRKRRERYAANPEKELAKIMEWREKNPEKHREYRLKSASTFREKHPLQQKAGDAVSYALRKGTLKKEACFICGKTKVEAHHPSYDEENWLNVQWLCHKHHYRANRMKGLKFYTEMLDIEYEERHNARRSKLVGATTAPSDHSGET